VRVVRKTVRYILLLILLCKSNLRSKPSQLLSVKPPLPIPPNSKRRMYNGWAMIDAGNFAVHIMSKQTREKYFENIETRSSEW
jgi:hypothetical protein